MIGSEFQKDPWNKAFSGRQNAEKHHQTHNKQVRN